MLSCEYKVICLSSDWRRSVENSFAHFILEINNFIKSELILLVSKDVESVIK